MKDRTAQTVEAVPTGAGMRWPWREHFIELTNEPTYSFGSVDNVRRYTHEYLLESVYRPISKHGIACSAGEAPPTSAVLGAAGGATGIHEHSMVVVEERCLVAVGDRVACLRLPDLALVWERQADRATCFGLHISRDRAFVIVHGELEVSRLSLDGRLEWAFSGRDIFTGEMVLGEHAVEVADFNGQRYSVDMVSGVGMDVV